MHVIVIGNPVAGRGSARRQIDRLEAGLRSRGLGVEVFLTGGAGDATRLAREEVGRADRVVVVGGDGTINEVLNGLTDPSRVPMALLAVGTANVMSHELRLPKSVDAVAQMVAGGRVRRIDMGVANGTRFLSLASVGFDAMVTREIKFSRGKSLGYRGYIKPIFRTLWRYRVPQLRVCVDGGDPVRGAMVVVGNTRNYGGLFSITDRACCDSGHLDVCVIPRGSRTALVCYGLAALAGLVTKMTGCVYLTGEHISITSDEPVATEIDGEYFGQTPLDIHVVPGAIPILTPAS